MQDYGHDMYTYQPLWSMQDHDLRSLFDLHVHLLYTLYGCQAMLYSTVVLLKPASCYNFSLVSQLYHGFYFLQFYIFPRIPWYN